MRQRLRQICDQGIFHRGLDEISLSQHEGLLSFKEERDGTGLSQSCDFIDKCTSG